MSTHGATISWQRGQDAFLDGKYSRRHVWRFDGGVEVPGSSSPHTVRAPYSDPHAVDPEEAFVASIASCHMLWFLSIAAGRGFRVDRYVDEAVGTMARNAAGKLAVTRVVLRPTIAFSGDRVPARGEIDAMHHEAHAECFIANSVTTEITIEPAAEETLRA